MVKSDKYFVCLLEEGCLPVDRSYVPIYNPLNLELPDKILIHYYTKEKFRCLSAIQISLDLQYFCLLNRTLFPGPLYICLLAGGGVGVD